MRRSAGALAVVLTLLPTQLFFSFLYYTDVASMVALLLTQLLLLRGALNPAALAAAAAVGVRQTNAVWVTLMVGGALLEELLEGQDSSASVAQVRRIEQSNAAAVATGSGSGASGSGSGSGSSLPAAAEAAEAVAAAAAAAASQKQAARSNAAAAVEAGSSTSSLYGELCTALQRLWLLRHHLVKRYAALLLVPAAFAVFVVVNGGITVGDREAHAPVLHLAQPLYFGSFLLAAAGPLLLAPAVGGGIAGAVAAAARRPVLAVVTAALVAAVAVVAVQRGTLAHPYLLADNRHYTFYIWRRLFERHPAVRYALVPAHLLGWWLLLSGLVRAQRRLWCAAFVAAAVLTLAPAWLVEFRYFTPGYILGLVHAWTPAAAVVGGGGGMTIAAAGKSSGMAAAAAAAEAKANAAALLVTGLGYAAVNAATLYMFMARPFVWPDGSTARFMW